MAEGAAEEGNLEIREVQDDFHLTDGMTTYRVLSRHLSLVATVGK